MSGKQVDTPRQRPPPDTLAAKLAFGERPCIECEPLAGIWYPAAYYTDGRKVVAVGCGCKPCEAKGLFCKSCRTRKAYRDGKPTPELRWNNDFGVLPGARDPPAGLREYAEWVSHWMVW